MDGCNQQSSAMSHKAFISISIFNSNMTRVSQHYLSFLSCCWLALVSEADVNMQWNSDMVTLNNNKQIAIA